MIVYLDTSVIVAVLLKEPSAELVAAWIEANAEQIITSDFGRGELWSAIGINVRHRKLPESDLPRLLDRSDSFLAKNRLTTTLPEDLAAATTMIRDPWLGLRFPDAIHIAMARRLSARLLSLDQRQVEVAQGFGIEATDPLSA